MVRAVAGGEREKVPIIRWGRSIKADSSMHTGDRPRMAREASWTGALLTPRSVIGSRLCLPIQASEIQGWLVWRDGWAPPLGLRTRPGGAARGGVGGVHPRPPL